ncbi:MAG: endonuclease/exonuclease/phosphatase family protein [Mucinivorans sp.]
MGKKATLLLTRILLQAFTVCVALLTVAGWSAGFISPDHSQLITFMGLGLTLILMVDLILFVGWIFAKSLWALVPLAVILLNIGQITSIINIDLRQGDDLPAKDFTIATYNIHGYAHHDFNKTLTNIAQYMNEEKVNILCMQEFIDQRDQVTDSVLNMIYPYHIVKSEYRSMQLAVFSKYPILNSQIIQFRESANCAMWADIDIEGQKIRIFNIHLQTTNLNQSHTEIDKVKNLSIEDPESQRAINIIMARLDQNTIKRSEQVRQIHSEIDKCPKDRAVIVCGDFNDPPSSYTYHQLVHELIDGFKSAGSGYAYTFKPMYHLFRLDYIFHSPLLQGIKYSSPNVSWSDHNPVLLDFAFNKPIAI